MSAPEPPKASPDALPATTPSRAAGAAGRSWVPIRSLAARHRKRIAAHLLSLVPADRYLRFGYAASDEQITRYVDQLDFERDEVFGIFSRRLELIAMAHLAHAIAEPAHGATAMSEFGVSVLPHARGRGFGQRLFEHAMLHARNRGVELLLIHALSENTAMLKIARSAGAIVERDGSEAEAFLRLPAATLDSRMTALVHEQLGLTDYRLKAQAKQFRDLLASVQEVRRGMQEARSRSGR
jgi:GNAT superfamily N-acetyltransferase